ncbi:MAG: EI24 domain-containing protein [Saprospiraceae bacterium]
MTDLIKGIKDYKTAFNLIFKLKLWRYLFLVGLLSTLFGIGIIYGAYSLTGHFSESIQNIYPFEFGKEHIVIIAKILSIIITILLAILLYKYIIFIILVPFLGPMSESIEEYLTGQKVGYPFWNIKKLIRDILRGLRISTRLFVKETFWIIIISVMSFIPILTPLIPILIFFIQAFYAGYGNFDWTLERFYNVNQRIEFIRNNRMLTIGNGIPFILLMSIPILGFFLAPILSVGAATISVVEKIEK